MRHIVLIFLIFVAIPATAQAPEMRYGCDGDKLYIQIAVQKAGVYTIVLPSAICGPSI